MIHIILTSFLLVTSVWSQFNQNQGKVSILHHENVINGDGNYKFMYKTSDGSFREEQAELKNQGSKEQIMVVRGSYSFVGTDGNTYKINYIADENGYRATGDHIPKN